MTNFEKWFNVLVELKDNMAVVNGVPKNCDYVDCDKCDLFGSDCTLGSYYWLWEECYE